MKDYQYHEIVGILEILLALHLPPTPIMPYRYIKYAVFAIGLLNLFQSTMETLS